MARADAAYFLGVISAGRYREISKPAATWHMVGLVHVFFIPFLLSPARHGPILSISTAAGHRLCSGSSIISQMDK
jgi:hypothetical protein